MADSATWLPTRIMSRGAMARWLLIHYVTLTQPCCCSSPPTRMNDRNTDFNDICLIVRRAWTHLIKHCAQKPWINEVLQPSLIRRLVTISIAVMLVLIDLDLRLKCLLTTLLHCNLSSSKHFCFKSGPRLDVESFGLHLVLPRSVLWMSSYSKHCRLFINMSFDYYLDNIKFILLQI